MLLIYGVDRKMEKCWMDGWLLGRWKLGGGTGVGWMDTQELYIE